MRFGWPSVCRGEKGGDSAFAEALSQAALPGSARTLQYTEYMQVFGIVATSFTICVRARHEHKWVARGNCQLVNATARWTCRILHWHLSRLVLR